METNEYVRHVYNKSTTRIHRELPPLSRRRKEITLLPRRAEVVLCDLARSANENGLTSGGTGMGRRLFQSDLHYPCDQRHNNSWIMDRQSLKNFGFLLRYRSHKHLSLRSKILWILLGALCSCQKQPLIYDKKVLPRIVFLSSKLWFRGTSFEPILTLAPSWVALTQTMNDIISRSPVGRRVIAQD